MSGNLKRKTFMTLVLMAFFGPENEESEEENAEMQPIEF